MKCLHLHASVPDIEPAIAFCTTLIDARSMMDDPRVNLAISTRSRNPGVDHVGIQVDAPEELAMLATRLKAAGNTTIDQQATACCAPRTACC